ncbi:MAG: putative beta-ketoacyl synthase [Streblomastix strix]|uniref:Putative beta-ketoacyl synthase n=1 Tax=Streblomastix strix TaxID=222440 RepID=A0A5J4W341_9EUKA|nr:MAG: putative beta-ketoacyl synthase [Streblomastix strix]
MIYGKGGWFKGYENDKFEQQFFYFLPHEFKLLDSHQRLSFEVAYETFEDDVNTIDVHTQIGISSSIIVNKLSYFYNLLGPSFIIDTTCSSTLFSLNCACQRIRNGESRSAFCDGQCKAFCASANGYVKSEGAGMLLLKPLSDAERVGNRILALIRGTATCSDGKMEQQMAFLSGEQQVWLFDRVHRESNVLPSEVNYIQVHDTDTLVSDPVECKSMRRFLNVGCQRGRPIVVGSVKSNVGHLEPAAGIVSQIKVAYATNGDLEEQMLDVLYKNIDEDMVFVIVFKAKVRFVNVLRFWLYLDGVLKHLY